MQVRSAHGSTSTSKSSARASFDTASANGDTIVLFVRFGGATISSVTDNQAGGSNTYTSVVGPTQWGVAPEATDRWAQVFLARNISGGGKLTITVTLSAASTHDIYLAAIEYSGVDPVNPVNATAYGTGTVSANGAPVTGNLATKVANTKLVATSWDSNEPYTSTGNGVGYATDSAAGNPSISGGSGWANLTEDRSAASVGTWNATARSMRAVDQWVIQLIALAPAPLQAVTAHPDGTYSFSNVVNGNYSVTPNKTGLTFSLASTAIRVNGASATGVNFIAQ